MAPKRVKMSQNEKNNKSLILEKNVINKNQYSFHSLVHLGITVNMAIATLFTLKTNITMNLQWIGSHLRYLVQLWYSVMF